RSNDYEVRKDEGPTPGPGPPEPASQIGNEDTNLNGERAWQRLTYRDRFAHLLSCQPFALRNKLPLHLPNEGDRTSKPHEPQPQEVGDQLAHADFGRRVESRSFIDRHLSLLHSLTGN